MSSKKLETSPLLENLINASSSTTISQSLAEKAPTDQYTPKIYKRRWWVLLVFCLCTFNKGICWLIWKPLSDSFLIAYDWDVTEIGLASSLTSLSFVFLALPVMYIVENHGVRAGVLLASASLVLGCALWNLALHSKTFWLFLFGSTFIGVAPTVTAVMPSLFSVTWFPVSQRTTATCICVLSLHASFIAGYVAGPQICDVSVTTLDVINRHNLSGLYVAEVRHGIESVGYFLTILTVVGLILVIAYFPASPPTPPSLCQTVKRIDFWPGLKRLARNRQYWMLITAFTMTNATVYAWLPLISVSFRHLGIDEVTASWMSVYGTLVGTFALLLISFIADMRYFKRKTRAILKGFAVMSIVVLTLLACIQKEWIILADEAVIPTLYLLIILVNISAQSIFPICSELACEYAYPVHEGLAGTVLMLGNGITAGIFYGLLLIPALSEETIWMTLICILGSCITLPLLILLKDDFRRLDLDEIKT